MAGNVDSGETEPCHPGAEPSAQPRAQGGSVSAWPQLCGRGSTLSKHYALQRRSTELEGNSEQRDSEFTPVSSAGESACEGRAHTYVSLNSQGLAHAGPHPGTCVNLGHAEVTDGDQLQAFCSQEAV